MTKQSLFYESAVPLSAARHRATSFEADRRYAFSAGVNAVPLTAIEFVAAAAEYAIVFADLGRDVVPAAILGLRPGQNLYVDAERGWQARYVPACVRRYPFVLSASADGRTLTLCIDETHPGLNREGRGRRLFTDDDRPSDYTEQVLRFVQAYQRNFERTLTFGRRVRDLGLLQPLASAAPAPPAEPRATGGFMTVSRDRLRALDGATLASLASSDELELLYLHLHSLPNLARVTQRLRNEQPATMAEPTSSVH